MKRIWVVEASFSEWEDEDRWEPTVATRLTKREALPVATAFERANAGVRTRVRCYVPREEPK